MGEGGSGNALIQLLFTAGFVIPAIAVLLYCGMLSLAVAFLVSQVLNNAPLTLDLSAPHASGALWAVFLVVGLTLFGYYARARDSRSSDGYWTDVANILSCPSCAAVILPQEAGERCPKCHTRLPQSEIETVMPQDLPGMDDATRLASGSGSSSAKSSSSRHERSSRDSRPSSSTGWLSSSGAIDHGRFEPGTLLGGRYRIVERLGRGGMGEVYRADDLKLGQPVALKFLPPDVDRDPARLTQLHTEVRMARQVSHPNVCRVYDIDEVDGATFLSMEYVDGEDLASLLRRVGRFPEERGARDRATDLCRAGGGARARRHPSRPQARQRDARRHGQGAHHGLRAGGRVG